MTTVRHEKDKGIGLLAGIVEVVGGWFGFLGIGYLLAGVVDGRRNQVINGLLFMVCWWITLGVLAALTTITGGLGLICVGPIVLIVPLVSGISLMTSS